jgi:hypothetical protein
MAYKWGTGRLSEGELHLPDVQPTPMSKFVFILLSQTNFKDG